MWSITLALPVFLLAPEATPPESGGTAWLPSKSNFVIDVARVVAIAATTCGLLCHWQTTTTTSLSCRHRPSNNNSESVPHSRVARPCIISGGTTGCTHVHRHNNNNNLLLLRQLVQCYPFLSSLTKKRTNSN